MIPPVILSPEESYVNLISFFDMDLLRSLLKVNISVTILLLITIIK